MLAMVVDDSRSMRLTLALYMTGFGFDVIEAGDGADALAKLDAGARPDVVFVDWNMPTMDGLTFIKQCRANQEYQDIVLMMLTTESSISRISQALAAGAHEYVIKPFTKDVIAEKLKILGVFPSASSE
jgi:two-component system chemotaxis response regulator CheY